MEKYYYLLIDVFSILFPFLFSFDKRVSFYKSWPGIFKGIIIGGLIFVVWDHYFTVQGIWSFNPKYITGIHIASLPLEEVLFFVFIPYSCIFIWHCVEYYFPNSPGKNYPKYIWAGLLGFSVFMIVNFHTEIYTLVTFTILSVLLIYYLFNPKPWHSSFLIGYVISLIPFFIVNGLLTSIPIVLYNDLENTGFRWGTIPFEDSFYMLGLLMVNGSVARRSAPLS
ncbi:MAG: lycopene cyclase domain-containing protein [Sphingobacteriales bacterium]|nr:lycopene cyclase domain-containing protein [Sphingobacteriales bacterium]